jgi:hypothetical protein
MRDLLSEENEDLPTDGESEMRNFFNERASEVNDMSTFNDAMG